MMEAPDQADVDDDDNTSELVRLYYHCDGRSNVARLTAAAQTVVESYESDPYGNVSIKDQAGSPASTSPVGNPFVFQRRRHDDESGLMYFRARHYDPVRGHWLQRDPLGFGPGANWREFCSSAPLVRADPSGMTDHGSVPAQPGWANCREQANQLLDDDKISVELFIDVYDDSHEYDYMFDVEGWAVRGYTFSAFVRARRHDDSTYYYADSVSYIFDSDFGDTEDHEAGHREIADSIADSAGPDDTLSSLEAKKDSANHHYHSLVDQRTILDAVGTWTDAQWGWILRYCPIIYKLYYRRVTGRDKPPSIPVATPPDAPYESWSWRGGNPAPAGSQQLERGIAGRALGSLGAGRRQGLGAEWKPLSVKGRAGFTDGPLGKSESRTEAVK